VKSCCLFTLSHNQVPPPRRYSTVMSLDQLSDSAVLHLAPDGLSASVHVQVSPDGPLPDEMLLLALVHERQLRVDAFLKAQLQVVLDRIKAGERQFQHVIAQGTPPVAGQAGRIEFQPGFDPAEVKAALARAASESDSQAAPVGHKSSGVDHYTRSIFKHVLPGDHIATMLYPSAGIDGVDVCGGLIRASQAPSLNFQADDTILRKPDGTLYSMRSGVLEWSEGSLHVSDTLDVPGNVDFSTGHIDFPGHIIVRKSVRDLFKLTSRLDLEVHGLVEAAFLTAGRDANLKAGMAAKERGTITVQRDLHAKYLNNTQATIGRDLHVDREIVNCHINLGGRLIAPNAGITGGTLRAAQNISICDLGSESGVATTLELGAIPELTAILGDLTNTLGMVSQRREKIDASLQQLRSIGGRLPASEAEKLTELEYAMSRIDDLSKKLKQRLHEVSESLKARTRIEMTLTGRIYPKVLIKAGNYTIDFFEVLKGPVQISLDATGKPQLHSHDGRLRDDFGQFAKIRRIEVRGLSAAALRAA
jgi:uncharacterized protein